MGDVSSERIEGSLARRDRNDVVARVSAMEVVAILDLEFFTILFGFSIEGVSGAFTFIGFAIICLMMFTLFFHRTRPMDTTNSCDEQNGGLRWNQESRGQDILYLQEKEDG